MAHNYCSVLLIAALTTVQGSHQEQVVVRNLNAEHTDGVSSSDPVYWWKFPKTDCAYHDVTGTVCTGQSVSGCEATCLKTKGCMGFNYPHGILKNSDCMANKAPQGTVDLYIKGSTPQPPSPSNFPPIWPLPKEFTNGTTKVMVDFQGFAFKDGSAQPSTDLAKAFSRYNMTTFPHKYVMTAGGPITGVTVTVASTDVPLQLGVDETYTLDIPESGEITIKANTVYGAYHGMETLSQLVYYDFDTEAYFIDAAPWSISDGPRFAHREVLMDTARHFQPLQSIKNLVQSLTYSKINTVHWHIVDSQSFPYDSPTYPLLSQKGAYSNFERYSANDVQDIVEFGRERGVRFMVEFDVPGHAQSWCKGHPEICPSPSCTTPLNPATNKTFDLLAGLWKDITGGARGKGFFPDNMMHLGGDEVNTGCYSKVPAVAKWLEEHNLTPDGGYEYFVKRAQSIARGYGRDVVGWEEIWNHFGTDLDKSTIIHQWLRGSSICQNATSHGYRCLWSTDGVWYLDGLGTTWETMYAQEPCTGLSDDACSQYMLGGGGEMWGETVDTSDIQQTIWPRLAAIGERLWSPKDKTPDPSLAKPRFSAFRCLLNRRGVTAAPSNNAQARTSPPGPGGCYVQ